MKTMTTTTINNASKVKVTNKQSVMSKIKVLMMALAAMMALGFASCSSNDDGGSNNIGPSVVGEAKVQAVEAKLDYQISPDMEKLATVTVSWYDENGELQTKDMKASEPLKLDIKYNMSKAQRFGFSVHGKYNDGIEAGKEYDITYKVNGSVDIWKNGQKQSMGTFESKEHNAHLKWDSDKAAKRELMVNHAFGITKGIIGKQIGNGQVEYTGMRIPLS